MFSLPSFSLFFALFIDAPPATSTSPHIYTSYCIVFLYSPCPAWPIPFPCSYQPIQPHFRFFDPFMGTFLCTFTLYSMYIHTYMFTSAECIYIDRFFLDAASYQGRRDEYLNSVGKRPPKSVQIFRYAPYWMLRISHIADTQWEGLVVPNCNPQLSASWGCTATSSDQVQRKPNQWSGGNR
jgi:hypothetical protein